jgi:hypothetical protein
VNSLLVLPGWVQYIVACIAAYKYLCNATHILRTNKCIRNIRKKISTRLDRILNMAPPPPALAEETAAFHPSLWGDFFLTYQPPTAPQVTIAPASS